MGDCRVTRVEGPFWKDSTGEYVIRAYAGDKRYPPADYYTDDKRDAVETLWAIRTALAQGSYA